jgi:hypothetical protein
LGKVDLHGNQRQSRIAAGQRDPTLIDELTDPDAKPPISFHAGHYPEPF